jgi:hypothetical protein
MSGDELMVDYLTMHFRSELPNTLVPLEGTPVPSPGVATPLPVTPVPVTTPPPQPKFVLPPLDAEDYLDADTDDVAAWPGRAPGSGCASSVD